ncbi:hypothetical protein [Desertivirga brevis]|uniref:hypothetical protein n=1 Tax=Desertivirga brevis TaxID=2810310 RepID=UPI001A970EC3|nr:hypothetical protein [Pedobacter sp. SYSU D00873]
MEPNTEDYRMQLVTIYHRLFSMMVNLYRAGYQIAIKYEWKDLKHDDGTPMKHSYRMEYLQTAENPLVQMVVKMIRIVDEGYAQVRFANNLSEKELYGVETTDDDDSDDEDYDEELEVQNELELPEDEELNKEPKPECISEPNYLTVACKVIPTLFIDIVYLSGKPLDPEIIEELNRNFLNGNLTLKSEDFNVHFLIDIVNRLMKTVSGLIDDFKDQLD